MGLSNREIAERLKLSQHTIKNCLFRIFDKLGVSNRVELLFMIISHEGNAQSVLQYFLNERAYESLRDEASLAACRNAACRGVLIAQITLAQYHAFQQGSVKQPRPGLCLVFDRGRSRSSQACRDLAKDLTIEELLDAEQMAKEGLSKPGEASATEPEGGRVRRALRAGTVRKERPSKAY